VEQRNGGLTPSQLAQVRAAALVYNAMYSNISMAHFRSASARGLTADAVLVYSPTHWWVDPTWIPIALSPVSKPHMDCKVCSISLAVG
jgi:hypothetical protein